MSGFDEAVLKMTKYRPTTTLFMLISLDGKISTGDKDDRDFDTDLLLFDDTSSGISQYYDIEKTTDPWCLCTGKTQEKIGINSASDVKKVDCNIVIVDNVHLEKSGVINLLSKYVNVVVFTENTEHPAFFVHDDCLSVYCKNCVTLPNVLTTLYDKHGCTNLTVQSGGRTNGEFIRNHLIDYVDFVIAPIIVGGKDTPTVVDGYSLSTVEDLQDMAFLELEKCAVLKNNYMRLKYKVKNSI